MNMACNNINCERLLEGRPTLAFNELNDDPSDRPAIVPPLKIDESKTSSRQKYNKT